jgi:hypothetical protein
LSVLIDSYTTGYDVDNYLQRVFPGINNCGNAQCFTGKAGYKIKTAKFYLWKTGSPNANMQAVLYSISGTYGSTGVPNTQLAVSDSVAMSTVGAGGYITFAFSGVNQVTLTTNYYAIAVICSDAVTVDTSNYVGVGGDSSSPSHSGNFAGYVSGWSASATRDLLFYVYGDLTSLFTLINEMEY